MFSLTGLPVYWHFPVFVWIFWIGGFLWNGPARSLQDTNSEGMPARNRQHISQWESHSVTATLLMKSWNVLLISMGRGWWCTGEILINNKGNMATSNYHVTSANKVITSSTICSRLVTKVSCWGTLHVSRQAPARSCFEWNLRFCLQSDGDSLVVWRQRFFEMTSTRKLRHCNGASPFSHLDLGIPITKGVQQEQICWSYVSDYVQTNFLIEWPFRGRAAAMLWTGTLCPCDIWQPTNQDISGVFWNRLWEVGRSLAFERKSLTGQVRS